MSSLPERRERGRPAFSASSATAHYASIRPRSLDCSGRQLHAGRAFLGSSARGRVDPSCNLPVSPSASGLFDSTLALLELSDSNSGDGSPASSALPARAPLPHTAPLVSSATLFPLWILRQVVICMALSARKALLWQHLLRPLSLDPMLALCLRTA